MKLFFAILLYCISGWVYAQQEPSNRATELLLNAEPERIEEMIKFDQNKWGDSKDSIDYEVEKQAYCYIMVYAMIGDPNVSTEDQLIIRYFYHPNIFLLIDL